MLTQFKKRASLLIGLAVVCTAVAVVPQTASAQASYGPNTGVGTDYYLAPANRTAASACPGSSAPAAGFSDTTSTDVDCIKMFGITQGTTATTYEPDASIPRWQMALFLNRMLSPMGVAAAGATTVPSFTDTADLSAEIQAAITAIASHGITVGTSATTFGPNDNVTREQMALFLYRVGSITAPFDSATVTTRGLWHNTLGNDVGAGKHNYNDIAGVSLEANEGISSLYNAGVTGETCVADGTAINPTGGCAATYRPGDDMTRAEMASMIAAVLAHSNARPAGVTMQVGSQTVAGAQTPMVSVRNADFTPQLNTAVEVIHDPTQLTTAAALAANARYDGLGVCTSSVAAGSGTTKCLIDPADLRTNARGNVVATTAQLTTAASSTTWWNAWTGSMGTAYNSGSTTDNFEIEVALPATATGSTFADRITYSIDQGNALACDFNTGHAAIAAGQNDGICTFAGNSRTVTATMRNNALTTAGTAHTVADGYTFTVTHRKVDMLGNVTVTANTVTNSGNTATFTVTCDADNSATTTGALATNSSYWQHHDVKFAMATNGIPTGGGSGPIAGGETYPTDGGGGSFLNISCDDNTRGYDDTAGAGNGTAETLSVSQNSVVSSAAGTLVTATATTYDQYGEGIAGQTVRFMKAADSAGAGQVAILTTGAGGTATLNVVLCATADNANGTEAFSLDTTGVNVATLATSTPTNLVEGTTVYCSATDTVGNSSLFGAVSDRQEVQRVGWQLNSGAGAVEDGTAGDIVCTYSGQTTGNIAHGDNATAMTNAFNALNNVTGAVVTLFAGSPAADVANGGFYVTFAAGTGDHPAITCADGGASANDLAGASGALTPVISELTKGIAGVTEKWVDDNTATKEIVTVRSTATLQANGSTANVATYHAWTYDDNDVFMSTATQGLTMAAFEVLNAALTDQSANVLGVYRTAATTSGISVFQVN